MKNTLPTIKTLTQLVKSIKADIDDDFRAFEDDDAPGIQLTVGTNGNSWSYQTGDNSYSGSAYFYPYWSVTGIYRDTNCRELARSIQSELAEYFD